MPKLYDHKTMLTGLTLMLFGLDPAQFYHAISQLTKVHQSLFFIHRNGGLKKQYEGETNKAAMLEFMRNPDAPPVEKPKEVDWADEPDSKDVVHLTSETFHATLKVSRWCGAVIQSAFLWVFQRIDGSSTVKIDG
jgi:hypothetical protein